MPAAPPPEAAEPPRSDSAPASSARSDEELMLLTGRGDKDAFVALIHRYQQPLVNFFGRMGARNCETEDLAQETFLRLFAYRTRYRPTSKFRNLLYVLARHAWADMTREEKAQPAANSEVLETAAAAEPMWHGEHLDVQAALATLSGKLRTVLVLGVYQGLKQQEIAEVLGIPLGTVKSRMHLALKQLRETLHVEALANR